MKNKHKSTYTRLKSYKGFQIEKQTTWEESLNRWVYDYHGSNKRRFISGVPYLYGHTLKQLKNKIDQFDKTHTANGMERK